MKLNEIKSLDEGLIDKMKQMLGSVKSKIVGSMSSLLALFNKDKNAQLTTIETFKVREMSKEYEARVDTGATVCSIDAREIKVDEAAKKVSFKHNGKEYTMDLLKMKEVKNANGSSVRPRILLTYEWNGKSYSNIETSLADRSKMKFVCLIGRNLIAALKQPVHINSRDEGVED